MPIFPAAVLKESQSPAVVFYCSHSYVPYGHYCVQNENGRCLRIAKTANGLNKGRLWITENKVMVEMLGDSPLWVADIPHILLGVAGLPGLGHSFTWAFLRVTYAAGNPDRCSHAAPLDKEQALTACYQGSVLPELGPPRLWHRPSACKRPSGSRWVPCGTSGKEHWQISWHSHCVLCCMGDRVLVSDPGVPHLLLPTKQ